MILQTDRMHGEVDGQDVLGDENEELAVGHAVSDQQRPPSPRRKFPRVHEKVCIFVVGTAPCF